jgi:hypothetical protein
MAGYDRYLQRGETSTRVIAHRREALERPLVVAVRDQAVSDVVFDGADGQVLVAVAASARRRPTGERR